MITEPKSVNSEDHPDGDLNNNHHDQLNPLLPPNNDDEGDEDDHSRETERIRGSHSPSSFLAMDDRQSIYLDTISIASNSTMGNNRRSLALSRQTIYHSAEDVNETDNPNYHADDVPDFGSPGHYGTYPVNGILKNNSNSNNSSSSPQLTVRRDQGQVSEEEVEYYARKLDSLEGGRPRDEVTAPLYTLDEYDDGPVVSSSHSTDHLSNKTKKETITYSQWKARTWRRFQDGERSVDYVLVYHGNDLNEANTRKRESFELHLLGEGLELEVEKTQKIHFVKIHAPVEVLCRYCEILKVKMPIKRIHTEGLDTEPDEVKIMQGFKSFFGRPFQFVKLDPAIFPPREHEFSAEFSREKMYLFDVDNPNFFKPSVKIMVVDFILSRIAYSDDENAYRDVGIGKLVSDKVYKAAYPLHDGDLHLKGSERSLLLEEWASVKKWIHHQPLDNIREYFGAQIAMYFAWLGFYTHMLIPASVVGMVCFLYGLFTIFSNQISQEICTNNTVLMCPQCDAKCDYWYLSETCIYSRIAHLFDNKMTVFFATFMAIWAVVYLELWKRYSANLIYRWGLVDFCPQAEHARPEYLAKLSTAKKQVFNFDTKVSEPRVPFWKKKFPVYLFSFSVVMLFILMAVVAVFGVIIYRMSTMTSRNLYGNTDTMTYKIMVTPITAAVMNLLVITAMNYIYGYLAVWLTDMEYRRTQTEYDESLTLKIYLFQFINYYSSIFYIAFLKGKFVGYPAKYNRIFGLRQEECSPGGCFMELCIQLVIIMLGKQALNAFMEMMIPFIMKTWKTVRTTFTSADEDSTDEGLICCNQWTEDYKLLGWSSNGLFDDYLEMVIQYGFITLFVVAFPLAPVFALLNNIFEMRLDAQKFLKYYRRSVAKRIKDIGVWYNIMNILCRLAVVTSAFIIAFSSNFIPRLVYMSSVNPDHTDIGFLNHTLAYFNTKDFQEGTRPLFSKFENVETCRYSEYRNPPWADRPYKRPLVYWHILAARLAFIVVFQNVVYFVQMLVAWTVPDTPRKVRENVKREDYLTREIIIKHENMKTMHRRTMLRRQSEGDMHSSNESNLAGTTTTTSMNSENEVRRRPPKHQQLQSTLNQENGEANESAFATSNDI